MAQRMIKEDISKNSAVCLIIPFELTIYIPIGMTTKNAVILGMLQVSRGSDIFYI
jgi:hypothetical protein